jgi:uncharacterized protein (DUF952 family)
MNIRIRKLENRIVVGKLTLLAIIYKLLLVNEWAKFQNEKVLFGTELDLKDGFIHFSATEAQIKRVKQIYFKDVEVYLLEIDSSKLENLKYEAISNGDVYPHLYGTLLLENVICSNILSEI